MSLEVICIRFQYPQGAKLINDVNLIDRWHFHVAAIVIFFVWLELMMIVGRFPIFGLYVQMFNKGEHVDYDRKYSSKHSKYFSGSQLLKIPHGILLPFDGICLEFLHSICKIRVI